MAFSQRAWKYVLGEASEDFTIFQTDNAIAVTRNGFAMGYLNNRCAKLAIYLS